MNHVIIDVDKVLEKTGDSIVYERDLDLEPIAGDSEEIGFDGPVVVQLRIENTGAGILVGGEVSGKLRIDCSRCLCAFTLPVRFEMCDLYVTDEPEDEGLRIQGDVIDIGPAIVQGFILEHPIASACDIACKGLCPVCGGNLNLKECGHAVEKVDERMAALKKWLEQQDK